MTAAALETRLRERFTHAAVHARELSDEQVTVWYVYRDGHWTSGQTDAEGDRV